MFLKYYPSTKISAAGMFTQDMVVILTESDGLHN